MTPLNEDLVDLMTSSALDGMLKANPIATPDELLSGALSLSLRLIVPMLALPGVDPDCIRQSLELLMLMTVGPRETVQ